MPKTNILLLAGILSVLSSALPAAPKVETQDVAPISPGFKYVVSPRGVHVAAVMRKGIHWEVRIDGADGPRIDAVVTPTSAFIDARRNLYTPSSPTGRYQTDQIVPQPVTFNRDGTHCAYLARVGNEWVLYKDQQEILRLPASGDVGAIVGIAGSAGNTDIRLQFAGSYSDRLLFAMSSYYGYQLWVDGKQWPGYFADAGGSGLESTDPLISPDGDHIAYPAQLDRDHRGLVVDGQVADYYADHLTYTSDSRHLLGESPGPKGGTSLMEDGKRLFTANTLISYYCAPVTDRIAAVMVHRYPDGSQGQFLVIDGRPVPATLCHNGIQAVVFSPNGQHYATVCQEGQNNFVVEDGKKVAEPYDTQGAGQYFNGPPPGGIAFSPDSSRLIYVEHGAGKYVMVVNGDESDDAFDHLQGFLFSAAGGHYAYCGDIQGGNYSSSLDIDGKTVQTGKSIDFSQFAFSPDGSRWADVAGPLYVDGKSTGLNAGYFWFSPDSQHIAEIGFRPADNTVGLWLDGHLVYKGWRAPKYVTFSADSQHLFWCAQEPDPSRKDGNYFVFVTYADGQPVARSDAFTGESTVLMQPAGYMDHTIHPGWQAVGPSSLACLVVPVGGDVQHDLITPADSSLDTLLAAAKSAPIHP